MSLFMLAFPFVIPSAVRVDEYQVLLARAVIIWQGVLELRW